MSEGKVFVQVGAGRDGLDPYLGAARRRGMTAILAETPDHLRWRSVLGRSAFDAVVAVDHPADPGELSAAIRALGVAPAVVLAGFERYVDSAYRAARALGAAPSGQSPDFCSPYKRAQRTVMTNAAIPVRQPRHGFADTLDDLETAAEGLSFPVVIKPDNGGGGLGVVMLADRRDLPLARRELGRLRNYDGGGFTG
ncbi:hypothetical protein [Actinoplanes sp. NPDC051851]|uniref:ATP-binding protein n=1 Tax=Actinoplanes sp. NPDC051851 TaxID=3154753 RepID=UPI003420E306